MKFHPWLSTFSVEINEITKKEWEQGMQNNTLNHEKPRFF